MASNLNDYEFLDKSNMHGEIKFFPQAVLGGYDIEVPLDIDLIPKRIVVCGMGGSGIPGDILKNYLVTKIPVEVIKDYEVPFYVDADTLVFVISYSGNTEESIEAYRSAFSKHAKVVAITSGGKLESIAKAKKNGLIKVPAGHQPRAALPFLFFALLNALSKNKIIGDKSDEVKKVIEALNKDWYEENAKELALKLKDKIPVIYASKNLASAALRWKTQINENAKQPAFANVFSEWNHNEILSYTKTICKFHVIMLIDEDDQGQIKKREDVTKELIQSENCEVTQIKIRGDSKLARIFSAIYLGDWVSFYLGVLNEVDPSSVAVIENLKKRL